MQCTDAARVHRLVVNGKEVKLGRPCFAVIDTGTTGLSISDTLYESPEELPLAGAAMRDVRVEFLTEEGEQQQQQQQREPPNVVALSATSRRKQEVEVLQQGQEQREQEQQREREDREQFPLVVTSVPVPWFEQAADYTSAKQRAAAAEARRALLGTVEGPHVLFVGLAFLANRVLTIDTDTLRMTVT